MSSTEWTDHRHRIADHGRLEFRRLPDERTPDNTARAALIERSILVLLFVGLFVGVLVIVKPFTTAIPFGAALASAG